MSSTLDLIRILKAELKAAKLTYADLGRELGMAESSVKRMFARGDMPLQRVDAICRVLRCDFADLARQMADAEPLREELSLAQEEAVVSDPRLLMMAICVLSQWTVEQMLATYRLTEAEAVTGLVQLDRLGIIELRPLNRYRLKVAKTFRWRPHGPVMQLFRSQGVSDYFAGGFDGDCETLSLVHGQISAPMAQVFQARLQRLAQDFAQQHLADQKLPGHQKRRFTLVMGMRAWLFGPLRAQLRDPSQLPE